MHKQCECELPDVMDNEFLRTYYEAFVLPEFGITKDVQWERHVQTGPDSFLHLFSVGNIRYALAFDDYPSGFSVEHESSVKSMRLLNGDEALSISRDNKYVENIFGHFMLFQVIDEVDFDDLVEYLDAIYARDRQEWDTASRDVVTVARDVLQLAETAAQNHDAVSLHSLGNIIETLLALNISDNDVNLYALKNYIEILVDAEFGYEYFSLEDKEAVGNQIYAALSERLQRTIKIRKYESKHLDDVIKLVHAMYTKTSGGMTEGLSIAITCKDDVISYPNEHFINDELKKYFAEHTDITGRNVEYHLPKELNGYKLVAETGRSEYVFKRELEYVGF